MMKSTCEKCEKAITGDAFICLYECTFCLECTFEMSYICPNCSGELVKRPNDLMKEMKGVR